MSIFTRSNVRPTLVTTPHVEIFSSVKSATAAVITCYVLIGFTNDFETFALSGTAI